MATKLPDTTSVDGQIQASAMLAKLCGWELSPFKGWIDIRSDTFNGRVGYLNYFNLYDPVHMYLAWRVLNWAQANFDRGMRADLALVVSNYALPPAAAQRGWLDKILELAIESGLIPS